MRTNKKIQAVIYKKKNSIYEFLILKYTKAKGGFYQNVTGGVEDTDKSVFDALLRELSEELHLEKKDILTLLPEVHAFEFMVDDKKIHETVFGIETKTTFNPILSEEHELFKWLTLKDAVALLKFESNKESTQKVNALLPN